jgi:F-type H+-transporting ATPase subunit b
MTPPDLSLLFVMVCFWLTLWLVYRYLIRPVGTVVAERRRRIDDAQQEWTAKNEEYQTALARVEDEIAQAAKDSAKIRSAAREAALADRQTTLDTARARADERLVEALDAMARDADVARHDLRRRAEELSRLLAGRLIGRELAS